MRHLKPSEYTEVAEELLKLTWLQYYREFCATWYKEPATKVKIIVEGSFEEDGESWKVINLIAYGAQGQALQLSGPGVEDIDPDSWTDYWFDDLDELIIPPECDSTEWEFELAFTPKYANSLVLVEPGDLWGEE